MRIDKWINELIALSIDLKKQGEKSIKVAGRLDGIIDEMQQVDCLLFKIGKISQ